jgi:hypothetical protein
VLHWSIAEGGSLAIYRDLGIRGGEAPALNERGTLYRVSGEFTQAEGCHHQALDLARAIASSVTGHPAGNSRMWTLAWPWPGRIAAGGLRERAWCGCGIESAGPVWR